jgi:hypothetical protein
VTEFIYINSLTDRCAWSTIKTLRATLPDRGLRAAVQDERLNKLQGPVPWSAEADAVCVISYPKKAGEGSRVAGQGTGLQ